MESDVKFYILDFSLKFYYCNKRNHVMDFLPDTCKINHSLWLGLARMIGHQSPVQAVI